jgi:hypothetical protein
MDGFMRAVVRMDKMRGRACFDDDDERLIIITFK